MGHRDVDSSCNGLYYKFNWSRYRNEASPKPTFEIAAIGQTAKCGGAFAVNI